MNLIEVGRVVNTHGIRGELKLDPWTDSIEALTETDTFYYKNGGQDVPLVVEKIRIHKNCLIIKAEGVETMQEAEAFRGRLRFVEREEVLPEGHYYIADLIGLQVFTEDTKLGKLTDVLQTGANDVYEVRGEGKPIYLPALSQVVLEINIEEGYMKVAIPEGLLDSLHIRMKEYAYRLLDPVSQYVAGRFRGKHCWPCSESGAFRHSIY